MTLPIMVLFIYHVIFFGAIYRNPMQMATSELLSTFFPTWIWQGREWAKGKVPKYDPYYWINAHAHPVVSTYYPPSTISSAMFGKDMLLDRAFGSFVVLLLIHPMFCSVGWFLLIAKWTNPLVSLFGAITLTYAAHNIKQQPCLVYTIAWFPWALNPNPVVSAIAVGMMILAGYYPLALYLLPVVGLVHLLGYQEAWFMLGILIGLPQLIPFLRYVQKTIRKPYGEGKLGPWELKFYFGLTPLAILALTFKWAYFLILVPILLSYGLRKWLPRGYQRAWGLSVLISMYFVLNAMAGLKTQILACLILIQCFDLWLHNSKLLPTRPFSELPKAPSKAFNTKLTRFLEKNLDKDSRVSGLPFPLFTGHINRLKTLGYCGSMQLKLMAKWRNDTDPNGSGHHDYFRGKEDSDGLDISRTKYAFSRKKLDWPSTPIKYLYANPRHPGNV